MRKWIRKIGRKLKQQCIDFRNFWVFAILFIYTVILWIIIACGVLLVYGILYTLVEWNFRRLHKIPKKINGTVDRIMEYWD